jgi:Mn-dependent DtxR family transcriptional regulator
MEKQDFYTFNEYMHRINPQLTATMEDYLEMIFRLSREEGYTRTNVLAEALNVHPPAATRMVQRLSALGLVKYQKYGVLSLEETGKKIGASLYARHHLVEKFLTVLGVKKENLLEETEKIEHTLSADTLKCFQDFLDYYEISKRLQHEFGIFKSNL